MLSADVLSAEEELHWLALVLVSGLGPRTGAALLAKFRSPIEIFRACTDELKDCGISGSIAQTIASGCTFEDAVVQQEKLRAHDGTLITLRHPDYPARLREIYDPPVVLFARGRTELLKTVMIGVVGTRTPTPYGVAAAQRLSADLAAAQVTIASGMAKGIDTVSHRAVLEAGGNTVAVFGCGIDLVYPAENRKLAVEISQKGLLLSEYPMSTPPYPQNFPVRNRIVSGMSAGILVVEGAQYSGSAITARLAMDQQREVFAVPGNITSKMSWGPNLLIKQGAKLVQEWNDVVVELAPADRRQLVLAGQQQLGLESSVASDASEGVPAEGLAPQAKLAREVLSRLKVDAAIHLDALMESLLQVSSSEVIAALFELEIEGAVKQLPGKNFVKVW
ncbi:MAG: DNA-protecting protein DprA [Bryobacteraceae bacterium]|nr:DNA-protecting protein DprA [Bryobacteraceae bacterium]